MERTNKEGLTFEEWVCAAGVAAWRYGYTVDNESVPHVLPYSKSETVYRQAPNPMPGTVLLVSGTSRPPKSIPHKYTTRYYSPKVRAAWKAGEDPTEWRARA